MSTVLEVVAFNVEFYLKLPEQHNNSNDVHKTNSHFGDKYDIKSFELTTVLTSELHNVYQSKQNRVFVYSWNYSYSCSAEYSQPLFSIALVFFN